MTTQAKIAKTEESILKLKRHLKNKAFPKSLQYKSKANIKPELFTKGIVSIKKKDELGFVKALKGFNLRVTFKRKKGKNHMDCLEAAAICACICFQSAGGKFIIVKRL